MNHDGNDEYLDFEISKLDEMIIGFFEYLRSKPDEILLGNSGTHFNELFNRYTDQKFYFSRQVRSSRSEIFKKLKEILADLRYNANIVSLSPEETSDEKLRNYYIMHRQETIEEGKSQEILRRRGVRWPAKDETSGSPGRKIH